VTELPNSHVEKDIQNQVPGGLEAKGDLALVLKGIPVSSKLQASGKMQSAQLCRETPGIEHSNPRKTCY